MEQRAGGDGLDGLAQAHFVRQQGAFVESEVQHSLTLVRKKRHEGFLCRPFTTLDFLLVFAPQSQPLRRACSCLPPRPHLLRDVQGRPNPGIKTLQQLLRRVAWQERTLGIEPEV